MKKTKKQISKPAPPPAPKPQIPAAVSVLRREREHLRAVVEKLETRLVPVMCSPLEPRAAEPQLDPSAPLATQLAETSGIVRSLRQRLEDVNARLEV